MNTERYNLTGCDVTSLWTEFNEYTAARLPSWCIMKLRTVALDIQHSAFSKCQNHAWIQEQGLSLTIVAPVRAKSMLDAMQSVDASSIVSLLERTL